MTYNLRIKFKNGDYLKIDGLTKQEAEKSKKSLNRATGIMRFIFGKFWVVRSNGNKQYFSTTFVKHIEVMSDD